MLQGLRNDPLRLSHSADEVAGLTDRWIALEFENRSHKRNSKQCGQRQALRSKIRSGKSGLHCNPISETCRTDFKRAIGHCMS